MALMTMRPCVDVGTNGATAMSAISSTKSQKQRWKKMRDSASRADRMAIGVPARRSGAEFSSPGASGGPGARGADRYNFSFAPTQRASTPWPATANGRTSSTRRPRPTRSAARSSRASSRKSRSPRGWAARDPSMNPRLRLAIDKAYSQNMPKDTIERAAKRGAGDLEGVNYEEIRYEGYGINGAAVIVDCMTDNRDAHRRRRPARVLEVRRQPRHRRLGRVPVQALRPDRVRAGHRRGQADGGRARRRRRGHRHQRRRQPRGDHRALRLRHREGRAGQGRLHARVRRSDDEAGDRGRDGRRRRREDAEAARRARRRSTTCRRSIRRPCSPRRSDGAPCPRPRPHDASSASTRACGSPASASSSSRATRSCT